MAILQLRAARGWSIEQTATTFLITADTIRSWLRRIDEVGATAKRINHVWHVDLTLVPTQLGFWTSWLPFALLQRWPFA